MSLFDIILFIVKDFFLYISYGIDVYLNIFNNIIYLVVYGWFFVIWLDVWNGII